MFGRYVGIDYSGAGADPGWHRPWLVISATIRRGSSALDRTSETLERNSLMWLDTGIEFCLRGDLEAEEIEGAGLGGRWPCQDCCGACVAEADAVAGQVGEVLQEGAEAVDGLAVFGSFAQGFAARRGRDFGLANGR